MKQCISFAYNKQKIAEFEADTMEFIQQDGGLLVIASGEMVFQDTPSVENLIHHNATCHVTITKDSATVIEQPFAVTFFTLEPETLSVLLK